MFDFEHSVDEVRYIAIGKVGDVLLVVFKLKIMENEKHPLDDLKNEITKILKK